jgi:Tol biopolymer transport system component
VSWSPDGRLIAFVTTDHRLWVVRADGTAMPNVVADSAAHTCWAPTSDAVYFLRGPAGAVDLMKVGIDPSSGHRATVAAQVMSLPKADAFDIAPHGDVVQLVYTQTSPSAQVMALEFSGIPRRVTGERPLTEGTAQVHSADISPNGEWVAYGEARGREVDLRVIPFVGGPAHSVASSPAVEDSPAWSPDASRLAFLREDSTGRSMMVADLGTGALQRAGSLPGPGFWAEELFFPLLGRGHGNWSADGRHLAYFSQDLRRIALVDVQRQTESIIGLPDSVGTGYFFVVPSPDARELLVSTLMRANDWGELWLVSADGQRWRRLHGPFGESFPIAWRADGWIYLLNNRALNTDYGPVRLELWRMRGPQGRPELYSTLPDGCGVATDISLGGTRGVCNYVRYESDLYLISPFRSVH